MRIELLLGIIILLFLIGCQTQNTEVIVTERDNIDVPQPLPLSEGNTASILPVSTDSENTETIPPEPLILSGSPVIFYTAHLGKDSDILPVQIQEVSPEGEDLGGRGELIKVETDYYGIMGYFPQYEKNYLIHKTYSPSYASSFIYPLTHNGKLFLFQDWGVDEGKNEVKNGWILDPKTGEQLQSLSFSGDAAQIALVQDRIYYRSTTGEDIYGKRSSGGDLYLLELGSSSRVLLEYGDESNGGRLLGGDQLYSYGNGQLRTHDLEGNIVETHTLLSNEEDYTFYSGETGVWYTVKNYGLSGIPAPPDEKSYSIYKYSSQGEKFITRVTLDSDETGIDLDEEDGNLIIASYKDSARSIYTMSSVLIYDLVTTETKVIPVNQVITRTSPGSNGNQFWLLK